MDIPHLIQRLRADKTSGATTLGESAINIVEGFVTAQDSQDPREFSAALDALVSKVLMAQPSMAIMLDLARCVLLACQEGSQVSVMRQQVRRALVEFRRTLSASTEALCNEALKIFPPHATVLTYSNSTTVTAALRHAATQGHLDRVFLSEARPAFDGRPLARTLVEAGVTVEYYIDMGLFAKLAEADVVVLGADAIFPMYFLNKIGSHALVELARVRGVPCFALCAAYKFLSTADINLLRILEHPGHEVWPEPAPNVFVHNRYFEEIPLSLLRGIVSDQGVHAPEAVRLLLQQRTLPPALMRLSIERNTPNERLPQDPFKV